MPPIQPCQLRRVATRTIYNEFLDLFASNLSQYYQNSALDDLEIVESKRRFSNVKNKAEWLSDNLLKVVSFLTQRNSACHKAILEYSAQYEQIQKRRPAFKINNRRRTHITYG